MQTPSEIAPVEVPVANTALTESSTTDKTSTATSTTGTENSTAAGSITETSTATPPGSTGNSSTAANSECTTVTENSTATPSGAPGSSTSTVTPPCVAFSTEHEEYLAARGIPLEVAAAAGLKSVNGAQAAKLVGFARPIASDGLAIPYEGMAQEYTRVRNNDPEAAGCRFFAPTGREVPLYRVPSAVSAAAAALRATQAAAPPPAPQTAGAAPVMPAWCPPPAGLSNVMFVVEGPIKAIALAAAGVDCRGLGGVSTTLTGKGEDVRLNSSWPAVKGRTITICFDAGTAVNPGVARAQGRLVHALQRADATVLVAKLPLGVNGCDQGPDDYLAKQGAAALWNVLGQAVDGPPLLRAATVAAPNSKGALNDLMDDLPFRVAVFDAGIGVQRNVRDILTQAGLAPKDWTAWMARTKALLAQAAKDALRASAMGGVTYEIRRERLCIVELHQDAQGNDEEKVTQLCNFTAKIVEETTFDDGHAELLKFTLAGKVAEGRVLPRVTIDVKDLSDALWPVKQWGSDVQVVADSRKTGDLRLAIQQQSLAVKKRVYQHTGWTQLRDETGSPAGVPIFLHADGAVGAADISVQLDSKLAKYRLPTVVVDVADAIRASLALLDIGPLRVTLPLLLAVYLAPLVSSIPAAASFLIFLVGKSGSFKTVLAALFSAHEGEELHDRPVASFADSIPSLESKLTALKDVVCVVDDFKPTSTNSADDMRKKATTLVSMIGNAEGRGRNSSGGAQRTDRPPRGFVIATGEMLPEGESTLARMLTLTLSKSEVDTDRLTEAQGNSARLSHAKLAFLEGLRPQLATLIPLLKKRFVDYRSAFLKDMPGGHLRSPAQLAYLALGIDLLADFARDHGVFTEAEWRTRKKEWWKVLDGLGEDAGQRAAEADPARRFVDVLRELLTTGAAELQDCLELEAWINLSPKAAAVGWVGPNMEAYLLPDATYAVVAKAMQAGNEPLPYTGKTLWPRLRELGLIEKGDRPRRLAQRHTLGGQRVSVMVMPASVVHPTDPGDGDGPQGGGGGAGSETGPDQGKGLMEKDAGSGVPEGGLQATLAAAGERPNEGENGTNSGEQRTTEVLPWTTTPGSPFIQLINFIEKDKERKEEGEAIGPIGPRQEGTPSCSAVALTSEAPERVEKTLATATPTLLSGRGPSGPTGPLPLYLEPNPAFSGSSRQAYRWSDGSGGYTALTPNSAAGLSGATVVAHDGKPLLKQLAELGVVPSAVRCTQVGSRLLTGSPQKAAAYEAVCRHHLGSSAASSSLSGLDSHLQHRLTEEGMGRVARLEFELLPVVARMEHAGLGVDADAWRAMMAAKQAAASRLGATAMQQLGVQSLADDVVLAALQAKGLAITHTKGEVLAHHLAVPGVTEFLGWRRLMAFAADLGGTVLKLVNGSHYTGRVHASFDALGARTGRMTCSEPNLHGLLKETAVRRCVVPSKGMVFVVADYSAIDLRVLAHVTGDENLRALFEAGGDPHRRTAALMLGKPEAEATAEERQRAKPVNFGIVLGMGAESLLTYALEKYGVALSLQEAKRFQQALLTAYPRVAAWQKKMQRDAPAELRTPSGRRRTGFAQTHGYTERLSTEIQGPAADGMKQGMVLVDRAIAPHGARIVLAVHDELLVETPVERAEEVKDLVVAAMVAGMSEFITSVPITVAASIRTTWAAEDSIAPT